MRFEICGGVTIAVDGSDHVVRYVEAQLRPYRPLDDGDDAADVILAEAGEAPEFTDVQNPATDGVVTASDGARLHLVRGRTSCSLPELDDAPLTFAYERGFPVPAIFRTVIRPAIQIALLRHGAVAVHSASVELGSDGVVIAGWSESGKTETALALMERGARFVSDKWTVVDADGAIGLFPISVGVRRWVLEYLPRLRASLPRAARAQLAAAAALATATAPVRRGNGAGRVRGLAAATFERAVALADRAAVGPVELAAAYGHEPVLEPRVRASTLVVLTTVAADAVTVCEGDLEWAARRLARSAAYERRALLELERRRRFAFPHRDDDRWGDIERAEHTLLRRLLADARVLEVRAPFPVDPTRVADAIARRL